MTEPVTKPALLPALPVEKVPVALGLMPTTIDEAWRLATMMAKSQLVPKAFQGKPEDVLIVLQLAAEVGLPPMQALQSTAVINGRPALWGDTVLALVMTSRHYADHDEYYEVDNQRRDGLTAEDLQKPTTAAVCLFVRKGKDTPVTRKFTVAQARRAGLLGTKEGAGKEGPWQHYPDRMLAMRARAYAARDAFPDVLRGIQTAEEVIDVPPDPKAATPILRRVSETPTPAPELPPDVPTSTVVARIMRVDQFLGGWTITLSDGLLVDTTEATDALDLEKFIGTPHQLRLTYTTGESTHQLQSFSLAE